MDVDNLITYIYTGADDEEPPEEAERVVIHESVSVIPERAFEGHENITELICHKHMKKIEKQAFYYCRRLKHLLIPGVEIVEDGAFCDCAIECVECDKLEIVGAWAFRTCRALVGINLPSAKIVEKDAFNGCIALKYATFGKDLESIETLAFYANSSLLERITIPLNDRLGFYVSGLGIHVSAFTACINLNSVNFIDDAALREAMSYLHFKAWSNAMIEELDSINHTLPQTDAGSEWEFDEGSDDRPRINIGERARVISDSITRVCNKIIYYKARNWSIVNEAASILESALPRDIVTNNLLPFLELPCHLFEGEEEDEWKDEESSDSSANGGEPYYSEDESEEEEEDQLNSDYGNSLEEEYMEQEGIKRRKVGNDNFTWRE